MKKWFFLLALLTCVCLANGQGFIRAEYFFDADPGVGNGTPVTLTGTSDTVNFSAAVPTGSLTPGFHLLGLRVRNNDGRWSHAEHRGFYLSTTTSNTADITAAEYFFDTDPGRGNGTPLPIGTAGSTVSFSAAIPISLPAGFHFLGIRTRDANGIWSHYEIRGFYISSTTGDAGNITAAEYFLNSDPGPGLGIPLAIGSAGGTVNFTAAIPTSLPSGFHFLAIRTRNSNGIWGHYEQRGFFISRSTFDAGNITAAEYFFDTDPGTGNGTVIPITGGAVSNFTAAIPANLSAGFHFLAIRTRNTNGVWSLFEQRGFYISPATIDMPAITAAEYYFNTDPGTGNGTPLTVTTPGMVVNQTFTVPVPGSLPNGQHFLAIRVRDASGNWSHFAYDTLAIGVSTITCPANVTTSTAAGGCSVAINNIDPTVTPTQPFTYTLSGATTGTGSGSASGQSFNAGVTTVTYTLTGSPGITCSFTITVNAVPAVFTTQPVSQTVCTGANVTFTSAATGTGLNFQWRRNGVNIPGATSPTLTLNNVTTADAGNYTVVISNACNPGVVSNTAVLTVNAAPVITSQPASQVVCAGGNVSFTVVATGTGLTYQWRRNGTNIAGANAATLSLINVTAAAAGQYDVVITASCGSVTSAQASLTVNAGSAITTQPSSQTVCAGANVTFTVAATGTGLGFQWRRGGVDLPGATGASLTLNNVTASDAGNYDVVVSASCGNLTSNIATLTVNATTAITAQPVSTTVCPGSSATFTVTAAGTGLTYQWRRGGVNITGATSATLNINNATAADAGNYDVVVNGACGSVTSVIATLGVNSSITINTQPQSQSVCAGSNVTFSVLAGGTGLTYQWRKGGVVIAGATAATFTINNVAAADAGSYDVVVTSACGTATSSAAVLTLNVATAITAQPQPQTVCAGTNASFSVTATGSGLTYQWRRNGVNIASATTATLNLSNASAADAGNYDVVVTGTCGIVTSVQAPLAINAATAITTQPPPQTVCAGAPVNFSVTAVGSGTISYQWRRNGTAIAGATAASFAIANATAADAGNYDVVVTATCGTVSSSVAALTVNATTAITTQPASQSACTGSTITLTVTASGSALTYQWRRNGVNISGATNASLVLNNVTAADAGNYDVVVSGACGNATSALATLTLNQSTSITTQPVNATTCAGSNVTFSVAASGTSLTYQWRRNGANIPGATASSFTLAGAAVSDAGTYDVVVTGSCNAVTSSVAMLTVNAPGTWLGVTSTNWNTASNWCGGVPTNTTDVTIPPTAPNMPNLSAGGSARNIAISNGGSLIVSTGGTLDLFGNITGGGTFNAANGTLAFRGNSSQSVPAFTVANLVMNGNGGTTLNGNCSVTGTLTLTNGHITLGSNSLSLASGITGSLASHIITNGNGVVVLRNLAAGANATVPVAFDALTYNPVVLSANAGHVTDDIRIRVLPDVLNGGLTGTPFNSRVVNRTWLIEEGVNGGSNVNLTLQWSRDQQLASFNPARSYVMQFGTAWDRGTGTASQGTDPFTQTRSSLSGLGLFAVQSQFYNLGNFNFPPYALGVYPNPVATKLHVVFELDMASTVTFVFYDAQGRLAKQEQRQLPQGLNDIPVDVSHFAAGMYILKVYSNRLERMMELPIIKY